MDSIRSLRCVSRKPWRSAVSLYSSSAIMFTGPICSMRWRSARQVSSSAASSSSSSRAICRVGAQHLSFDVDFGEAAGFQVLKIGVQLGHVRSIGCARSSRSLIQRGAAGLQLRLHALPVAAAAPVPARQLSAPASGASAARPSVPLCRSTSVAFSRDALLPLCRRRPVRCCSMARHAALQVGMQPVDALEGGFCAAPALFQTGQLRGHLRRFLLQALAFLRRASQLRLQLIKAGSRPARARPQGARPLRASR